MRNTTIYCLLDPKTFEVKYVGRTTSTIEKRLSQHYSSTNKNNGCLCYWIKTLKNKGLKPLIFALEVVPDKKGGFFEKKWIKYYDKNGYYLFNLINY